MKKSRLDATSVYLFIEFAASASFSMMFVVTSLYEATVAGLSPLQLVLVGTAVEASIFLFEVPTGVVADTFSRRLSLILGFLIIGVGIMVEALFPAFLPIILAQVIWGLGYTFMSGATQAWISDEIGEEPANRLFLRAAQVGLFASFLGMAASGLIGAQSVVLPLRVGAAVVMLIGVALIFIMPETGFKPAPREDRNTWQHMAHTFRQGFQTVRTHPRLTSLVWVGLFYGLYSEGFDRLWVKHLLDRFGLPVIFGDNQVAFLALVRMAGTLLTMLALRFTEKRVDTGSPQSIGRAMLWVTGVISAVIVGFAVSPWFALSIALYLAVSIFRNTASPLHTAWINQKLDPQVRATVHSMFGQVDAIGQVAGGPSVALAARFLPVAAAISASGLLLTPAWFFIRRANKLPDEGLPGAEHEAQQVPAIEPDSAVT